jgi:hypothetical protein
MRTTNVPLALAVSTHLLRRVTTSVVLSVLPPHERALRVSGQACPHAESSAESIILLAPLAESMISLSISARACPHAESIILSAGGAESMMLSACAESIILSALPAESMILSAPPKRGWATPAAQWAAGHEAIALGDETMVTQWTAQCHRSTGQSGFLFFRLVFLFAK